ncbi:MAG: hypothetical protein LIO43_02530, partial [Clostridiales bacterium]|nr:hypothetical protein [Clostridiales bacterium]
MYMIDQNQLRQKLETLANVKYLNRWVVFLSDLLFSLLSTLFALVFLSFTMNIPYKDLHSLLVISA